MVRILYTILAVSIMSVAQGEDVCNIERRTIVREEEMVLPSHPVIFEIGNSHINEQLIEAGSREHLREDWGEILYFPSNWYHATLNEAPYTLFVSVFL